MPINSDRSTAGPEPRSRRFVFLGIFLALSPCCVFPVACEVGSAVARRANSVPFDSAAWQAAESTERYNLAWDLVNRGVLNGKAPAAVRDLLGGPIHTEVLGDGMPFFDPGPNRRGTTVWYYDIGHEKYAFALGPLGSVLAVDFRDGHVVGVRRIAH